MSLSRINDFQAGTTIVSQDVDDEFNQLVNALNGTSTDKDILMKLNHATNPVLNLNQVGAGLLLRGQENGTDRFKVSVKGKNSLAAGNGSTAASVFLTAGGMYHRDFTSNQNSGAGETDLTVKSIDANVLGEDGDGLLIYAWGDSAANTNNKTIRPYFSSALDGRTVNFNAVGVWEIFLRIFRTNSNTVRFMGRSTWWNTGVALPIVDFGYFADITSLNFGAGITHKVTGQGTSNGDILQRGLVILKFSTS
jgi:hypothetical protein